MIDTQLKQKPRCVLVGLQLPDTNDYEHQASLAELGRLVKTLGFDVGATISQKRATPVTATVIGEGKLKELARLTGGSGKVASRAAVPARKKSVADDESENHADSQLQVADEEETPSGDAGAQCNLIVFDNELTPNQLRNLESATGAEIFDRTGIIVEIFNRHAKTRMARLQVEIARLKYLAPRLRQTRGGSERQNSGLGGKGAGESSYELDKRRIRDRIAELTREINEIHQSEGERRQRRGEQSRVALIGYTNAGKSSLMRELTGSDVLVEDKLFATLDTTIRAMKPDTVPRILISDTVGFIRKLPHDLVASFRSTLDEAAEASLLLFMLDAADTMFRAHLQVIQDVLKDINVATTPTLLVLNKVDCLDPQACAQLSSEFPAAIQLSTRRKEDVARLRDTIIQFFEKDMVEQELLVPYAKGGVNGEIRRKLRVISESAGDDGVTLRVRGPQVVIDQILALL